MSSTEVVSIGVEAARASTTRYRVVAFAVCLGMVTYLDRVCISVVAPEIMRDLGLSKTQMGLVFSAFALAYALFEIPTASWADRKGTRRVLARIVVWWSSFTIATACAFSYGSLLVIRFLFGIGEAGAWPSVARTFSRWIPRGERGTIQGIFFTGAHLAGGVTPILVTGLLQVVSWRAIFVLFGLVGFVWAAAWYWWFRDDPAEHPQVNEAELEYITAGRSAQAGHDAGWATWRRLATHRNMLALCLMYVPNSYAFYFCITWLPTYLKEKHGMSEVSVGLCAGLPLVLSVLGDLGGGVATDWASARFGLRMGRCGLGCLAYLVSASAMLLATCVPGAIPAAMLISVAVAASMFTLGASWATCQDVGGNHAAVVSAAMNTSGQLGSMICPVLTTALVGHYGDWNAPLVLIGILFLLGAACWCFIDPRQPVLE